MEVADPRQSVLRILRHDGRNGDFSIADAVEYNGTTEEVWSRMEENTCTNALLTVRIVNTVLAGADTRTRGDGLKCIIKSIVVKGDDWVLLVVSSP